jgi:twinkle protein
MARVLTADSIDFRAYMADTAHSTKVRPAREFFDDLRRELAEADSGRRGPSMRSTKVGRYLDFAPGEVTAWTGYNGHKKSMFTSQVALDLAAAGERVLIASFEMTPGKTLGRMARQAAATNRPTERWLDAFERWTDDRVWLFDHVGRLAAEDTLGLCRYFADVLDGGHVFIDSMMMVVGSEESMDEQKQFVTDLVRIAQDTGLHVHLITHCRKPATGDENRPPTKYDIRGAAAISDQVSNVVVVWANKAKKANLERNPHDEPELAKPDAMAIVEKQRNGAWEGKLQLWFDERSLRFCDDRGSPVEPYEVQT